MRILPSTNRQAKLIKLVDVDSHLVNMQTGITNLFGAKLELVDQLVWSG